MKRALSENKLISVIFNNQDDNYLSVICRESEKFENIEKKYFDKYPDQKQENNIFEFEGITIDNSNKDKTLKELNIKDNTLIMLK